MNGKKYETIKDEKQERGQAMAKIIYKNIEFASDEEKEFYMWCEEAWRHKIIKKFFYQPEPWYLSGKETYYITKQLKTKKKLIERELLKPHKYTMDFMFYTDHNLPFKKLYQNTGKVHIDVKGSFNKFRGDQEFSINQKWMYDKFDIYVHKVVPKDFFKATWVPEGARYSPKLKKERKVYKGFKTVGEYLELNPKL